jgi:hypothetical protein
VQRAVWIVLGLLAVATVGSCAFIAFCAWSVAADHPVRISSVSDCPPGPLREISRCRGGGVHGWQNSGEFYYRAEGVPKANLCSQLLTSRESDAGTPDERRQCDSDAPGAEWRRVPCSKFHLSYDACFACDRLLSNLNNHYYKVIALAADCSSGAYSWSATLRPTGSLPPEFLTWSSDSDQD